MLTESPSKSQPFSLNSLKNDTNVK